MLKPQFPLKFLPKDKNYVLCEGGLIYIYRPECSKPKSQPQSEVSGK